VVHRHYKILRGATLSKLILYLLLFMLFAGEAVADPNIPTSSPPPAARATPLVGAAPLTDASVTASTVATIKANQLSGGATIPPNFVGFSNETQDVIADTIFTPANQSLINLISYWLGPSGVWRIGGDASDTNPAPALTQQIANDAQAFISAIGPGWQTIYGLDAVVENTTIAVSQASYLLNTFASSNIAFQVGNEPDLNFGDMKDWVSVFNSYYSALTAFRSNLNFGGPDTVFLSDVSWINATIPGASGVQYVTAHKYTLGCTPQSLTPAQVLADAAVSSNPGVTLAEFGIICGGGQHGITDVLMSATYYLKLAQSAFAAGFTGILPHNVLTPFHWEDGTFRVSYYNQFVQQPDGGYTPAPMFYGMLLFQALEGLTSISTTTANLNNLASVTAALGPSGNAYILVVNGDTAKGITVKPQQTFPWSIALVYLISGQSCTDPSPVLNGYAIGENGVWAGSPTVLSRGQTVAIPACGAALIAIIR
jgi:hypothetical protein